MKYASEAHDGQIFFTNILPFTFENDAFHAFVYVWNATFHNQFWHFAPEINNFVLVFFALIARGQLFKAGLALTLG